jgi:multidrug resistance efflux pump
MGTSITGAQSAEASFAAGTAIAGATPAEQFCHLPWRLPMRPLKVGGSIAMCLAGAYGILSEQRSISSSNAVVSAYVVSVRTPIDGTVSGLPAAAGIRVQQGTIIGQVENPRVDRQHLDNLRVVAGQASSVAAAVSAERLALERQRAELLARAEAHAQAVSARLQHQITESERLLEAKQIALKQASSDLDRARQLHEAGILAQAEVDKLQFQQQIAVQEVAAQEADLEAVRVEAESAAKGLLSEPGLNDVTYSRQRADEITLRLAEIDRTLVSLQSQAREAGADVGNEAKRTGLMRQADLISPVSGLLWKLEAMNGEHVGANDSVAQFVDCSQDFLLVEIPQERVPDVAIGKPARFRLSGEAAERSGVVLSVSGDPQKENNRKLAASPAQDNTEQLATVVVGLGGGEGRDECIVGRTAHAVLPATRGSNVVSRWFRYYF